MTTLNAEDFIYFLSSIIIIYALANGLNWLKLFQPKMRRNNISVRIVKTKKHKDER